MAVFLNTIICLVGGYLAGCFQTAYLVGKKLGQIDIRDFGSGNAGMTNVLRVMGKKAAIITFAGDFTKAVISVLLFRIVFNNLMYGLIAGVAVVIGHNWPVFLKFRGGKGIAATIGLCYGFDWRIGIIVTLIMIVTIKVSKYVSLSSILMLVCLPVLMVIFYGLQPVYIGLAIVLTFLGIFQHRDNVKRLLEGTEKKIGQSKTVSNDKV